MNWIIFWMCISLIMMIGGAIWYAETNSHKETSASLTIVMGAVIMAVVMGLAI